MSSRDFLFLLRFFERFSGHAQAALEVQTREHITLLLVSIIAQGLLKSNQHASLIEGDNE